MLRKPEQLIEFPSMGTTYCRQEFGVYEYDVYPVAPSFRVRNVAPSSTALKLSLKRSNIIQRQRSLLAARFAP